VTAGGDQPQAKMGISFRRRLGEPIMRGKITGSVRGAGLYSGGIQQILRSISNCRLKNNFLQKSRLAGSVFSGLCRFIHFEKIAMERRSRLDVETANSVFPLTTSLNRKTLNMKALILAVALSAMAAGAPASAQPDHRDRADRQDARADHQDYGDRHDDGDHGDNGEHRGHGERHDNGRHRGWGQDYNGGHQWRRGERMGYNDWNGAQHINYREHHLRRPPYGYEWRQANGNYILAAIATGLIASIIMDGGR
jgi:Ni/Co efflux regulator RcnB